MRRTIVTVLVAAATVLALAQLNSDIRVDDAGSALALVLITALFNALIWPVIVRFTLPFTVLTLGSGALVLSGASILLVDAALPGVDIDGVGTSVLLILTVTATTTFADALLSLDDDIRLDAHRAREAERLAAALGFRGDDEPAPGVLMLEIDGLAHEVLQRAMRDGNAPTLARWVRDGTHHLHGWETDLSSQTGACQAGILHGDNADLPAFRWWEKDAGRAIVTNHPRDAAEIERRVSDGNGLLHAGGASRANILSGDATHSLLTMSTVLDVRRDRIGADYYAYFKRPFNISRTAILSLADVIQELRTTADQRRRDVQPRIERGLSYAALRAYATVVQRDLQLAAVRADIAAGRPVIYTTFLGYDEVAHHSGLERPDTLKVLRALDREIGRLATAVARAERPYEIVVLSDHGQTQGATFRQRTGRTLEDVVARLCATDDLLARDSGADEARAHMAAALTEVSHGDTRAANAVERATRNRTVDGAVSLDPDEPAPSSELPEVVVMASGNLGLVSFPRLPGRVSRQTLDAHYPELLPGLLRFDEIGFVMVRDEDLGPVVLGADGSYRLADNVVDGRSPLAPFGPNAARHLLRTDGFSTCPDLIINSAYWPETGEVAAFEELVGSHGGLGGPQSRPFLLVPAHWSAPGGPIVGAEHVHELLVGWLADLGHAAYAGRAEVTAARRAARSS